MQIPNNLRPYAYTVVAIGLFALLGEVCVGRGTAYFLVFGWSDFLRETLPKVKIRWDGVFFAAILLALSIGFFHSFVSWLLNATQKESSIASQKWRWQSSIAAVFLFLLIFVVGIAMAGVVHQVGWIWNTPGGFYRSVTQDVDDAELSPYSPQSALPIRDSSWISKILVYGAYYSKRIEPNLPWNDPANHEAYSKVVPICFCPSQGFPERSPDDYGLTHVVSNPNVTETSQKLTTKNVSNMSQTMLAGEISAGFVPWSMPNQGRDPRCGFQANWSLKQKGSLGLEASTLESPTSFFWMFRSIDIE